MNFTDTLKTKARVIVLVLLLSSGCSSHSKPNPIDPNDVESIYFGTVVKGVETMVAVTKFEDVPLLLSYRDTVIYSEDIIRRYINLVNNLEYSNNQNDYADLRIISEIRMKNKLVARVSSGYQFGIVYNEAIMNDNNELIEFYDSLLYAGHSPYYWATDFEKKLLKMQEIGDTSWMYHSSE